LYFSFLDYLAPAVIINLHPLTGIDLTYAYDMVRRWNAKECHIL